MSCLPDSPEVEEVHLGTGGTGGTGGTVRGAASGTVVVDCSTIAAEAARSVAARLAGSGLAFLDAPVSGGQKGAIEGNADLLRRRRGSGARARPPVLAAMGKRITHLGPSGAGQLGKAANQIVVAGTLVAVAEGLSFAAKSGLPLDALHEALTGGAANGWMLEVLGKKMIDARFRAGLRDQAPAEGPRDRAEDGAGRRASLPGTALAHQLLSALEAQGRGEEGTQALLTLYERMAR